MLVLPILLALAAGPCDAALKPAMLALQQNDLVRSSSLLSSVSGECAASSSFYALTAVIDELSGLSTEAERAFLHAISLDPKSPRIKEQLGATYLQNKKPAEAAAILRQAVAIDPTNAAAKKYLIGAYVETNAWDSAAALFDQLNEKLSPASDPVLLLWFTKTMIGTKQLKRLDRDLPRPTKAIAPGLAFSLGTVLAQGGLFQTAIEYLRSIPDEQADDAVYFNLGLAYSRLQRYQEARQNYFLALDKHPGNATAYFRIGLDYAASGDPRKALPWLFRAHQLNPSRADVCYALVEQLTVLNYNDTAQDVLAAAILTNSDDPLLSVAGADLKQAKGNMEDARIDYRRVLARLPDFAPALIGIARIDMATGDNAQARSSLLAALAKNPGDAIANGELGSLEIQQENWGSALNNLNQAWSRDKSNGTIALKLSRVERQLEHPAEALTILKEVRPQMQQSLAYHLELAQVYNQLHQPERADAERQSVALLQAEAQALLPFDAPKVYVH